MIQKLKNEKYIIHHHIHSYYFVWKKKSGGKTAGRNV